MIAKSLDELPFASLTEPRRNGKLPTPMKIKTTAEKPWSQLQDEVNTLSFNQPTKIGCGAQYQGPSVCADNKMALLSDIVRMELEKAFKSSKQLSRQPSTEYNSPYQMSCGSLSTEYSTTEYTPSRQTSSMYDEAQALKSSNESFTPSLYKKLPTTLMIRNIPQMYTQEELMLEWPNNGTYDFFYLPMNAKGIPNKTYAFINFTSPEAALAFKTKWDKKRLQRLQARRTLNVSCADVQGRDANLWQLRRGQQWRLKHKDGQPHICDNGVQISLAQAMRKLKSDDAARQQGSLGETFDGASGMWATTLGPQATTLSL